MRKNFNGTQQRNLDKLAQQRRRTVYASYAKDSVREQFKTPAYTMRKNVHAN